MAQDGWKDPMQPGNKGLVRAGDQNLVRTENTICSFKKIIINP